MTCKPKYTQQICKLSQSSTRLKEQVAGPLQGRDPLRRGGKSARKVSHGSSSGGTEEADRNEAKSHAAKRRHEDARRDTRRSMKRRKRSRKPSRRSEEKEPRSRGHAKGAGSAAHKKTERLQELDELLVKVIEGTGVPRRKLPINRPGERPRSQEEQQRSEYKKHLWRRLAGQLPMYHALLENRREAGETAEAGETLHTLAKMARHAAQEAGAAIIYREVWGQEITAQWIEAWKLLEGVGVRVEDTLRGGGTREPKGRSAEEESSEESSRTSRSKSLRNFIQEERDKQRRERKLAISRQAFEKAKKRTARSAEADANWQ